MFPFSGAVAEPSHICSGILSSLVQLAQSHVTVEHMGGKGHHQYSIPIIFEAYQGVIRQQPAERYRQVSVTFITNHRIVNKILNQCTPIQV